MKKNTQSDIENDYKEAIRNKYKSEKTEGRYSHYLNNPSQALLRDLCWEIFSLNPKADDLVVYRNFFKSEFNSKEENTSIKYTDKFRKVGAFLRGEKDPANLTTAELAAIFVDFEDRPFNKFRKKKEEIKEETVIEDDFLIRNFSDALDDNTKETNAEKKDLDLPLVDKERNKNRIFERLIKNIKSTMIIIAIVFCLISAVIYFAVIKKHCMQWSEDHYEVVDCNSGISGNLNVIIPFKDELLNFRKIQICDTTRCFKPDGKAIVWYAKTDNRADFFNTHGRHPENDKPLRPVTNYIINKYGEKSSTKK